MPAPTWTKASAPTVTFSKWRTFPVVAPQEPNQLIGETDGGQVQIAELGPEVHFIEGQFDGLTVSDIQNVFAFLNHSAVRWSVNTFTFTDEVGAASTVRYWGPFPQRPEQTSSGLYKMACVMRVEIP